MQDPNEIIETEINSLKREKPYKMKDKKTEKIIIFVS